MGASSFGIRHSVIAIAIWNDNNIYPRGFDNQIQLFNIHQLKSILPRMLLLYTVLLSSSTFHLLHRSVLCKSILRAYGSVLPAGLFEQ